MESRVPRDALQKPCDISGIKHEVLARVAHKISSHEVEKGKFLQAEGIDKWVRLCSETTLVCDSSR